MCWLSLFVPSATQYQHHNVRLIATHEPTNPFALFCHALVPGPAASRHASMNVTTFYDGGKQWRARPCACG